jgi:LmbE family N-acetylglucosaminyl deacetylase
MAIPFAPMRGKKGEENTMNEKWLFYRKEGEKNVRAETLQKMWFRPAKEERILFLSPHDDDVILFTGLLMIAAKTSGLAVRCLVTSDGRMGYCRPEMRNKICAVRKQETINSLKVMGWSAEDLYFLGFPDGDLWSYVGRRKARPGDPNLKGFTGLQNAYTAQLRDFKPTTVFVPAPTDLHPDHKIAHQEMLISLYHAAGTIWPELGKPIAVPQVYEFPCYCDLAEPPNVKITAPPKAFQTKLDAVAAFASQEQIDLSVKALKEGGPVEYYRWLNFRFFHPETYKKLFPNR